MVKNIIEESVMLVASCDTRQPGGIATYVSTVKAALEQKGLHVLVLDGRACPTVAKVLAVGLALVWDGRMLHSYVRYLSLKTAFLRRRAQRLMRAEGFPRVVHAQDVIAAAAVAPVCQAANIPLVLSVHGRGLEEVGSGKRGEEYVRAYKVAHDAAVSAAALILAPAEHLKNYLLDHYPFATGKVRVVPNFLPKPAGRLWCQESRMRSGNRAFSLVIAAALFPSKGVDVALQALQLLRDAKIEVVLHVLGDGPERGNLERLTSRLGIADIVRFHGRVSRESVLSFYRSCDLVLIPSAPRAGVVETFPYSALEAMALGCPIIATSAGGLREMIVDHYSGILVSPENPRELASAIREVLFDQQLQQRLSNGSLSAFEKSFSLEAGISSLLDCYSSVVRAKRNASGGPLRASDGVRDGH